jgi:glycerophosphoryl diester phosphodiesterase
VWFDIVFTKDTQLIRPHKPDMQSVHNSRLDIRAKTALSLTDKDESYHIETSE